MLLACSAISYYYNDEALLDFWKSAGITAGVGLLMAIAGKGGEKQLTRRDGYVLVSFAWVAFSLFGMLPFYISGYVPDITNAFFETMSGFTSTGATVLDNIESLPHGLLFWRGMTQWIAVWELSCLRLPYYPSSGSAACRCLPPKPAVPRTTRCIRASHHSQMDMEHLCRTHSHTCSLVNAGRHELVRQRMPCLCYYGHGWFLHQAGKCGLLQFSLYRICNLHFHVYFRH